MGCRYCSNLAGNKQYAKMEDFRRTPLSSGTLVTEQWLKIFKCFYDAGFRGISLTGGEPTLNPDWLKMLRYCKDLGYINTELTSNLSILEKYRKKLENVKYITKFKVSLDTFDKKKFNYITRSNALNKVLSNLIFLKKRGFNVQLNRVAMKSTLKELVDYIKRANELKININLLDLIYYKGSNSKTDLKKWREEFVSAEVTYRYLKKYLKEIDKLDLDLRYGFRTRYKNINIILKDSRLTKRTKKCFNCSLYCQEGIFTVRIASDGTISTCPDYYGELEYIDGLKALEDNTLTEKLKNLFKEFELKEKNYFKEYLRRLRNEI
jgi:molybdenum cofactor biosynthesis enzyme MoaA